MGTGVFFCKENSFTCEEILSTGSPEKINGSFALEETDSSASVIITHASSRDSGVYWCAEKTQFSRAGFQKVSIEVEEERSSTGEGEVRDRSRASAAACAPTSICSVSSAASPRPTSASTRPTSAPTRPTSSSPLSRGGKVPRAASCSRLSRFGSECSTPTEGCAFCSPQASLTVVVTAVVCGAALVLTLVLFYKRKRCSGFSVSVYGQQVFRRKYIYLI